MRLLLNKQLLVGLLFAVGLLSTHALAIETKSSTADHSQFEVLNGPSAVALRSRPLA